MKSLVAIAVIGGALYLGLVLLVYFFQERLIYPVPPGARRPEARYGELLEIEGDGGRVFALYRREGDGAPVVVHFHGNGEQLADTVFLVEGLARAGLSVLSVEYPGYGLARDQRLSEAGIVGAAERALEYLEGALGVPRDRIVLQGQSLGTGVAIEMARRGYGSRLILISPFTSLSDLARRVFPFLPTGLLLRHRFDSMGKLGAVKVPSLVIHGTDDEVIPFELGRTLAERLVGAKLLAIEGGGHNDLFLSHSAEVMRAIGEFASTR